MSVTPTSFFIDTCIWLDYFFPTRKGYGDATALISFLYEHQLSIYYSSGVLQNLSHIARAQMRSELQALGEQNDTKAALVAQQFAWSCIENSRKIATVVGSDESAVWLAEKFYEIHSDFEDCLVMAAVKRSNSDYLVTNDKALLRCGVVPAISSHDAWRLVASLYEPGDSEF
ncbi:MAG: PIN domain-containing protein [Atopobiaceae bacterium]|nr:PIN domain-containing protein [Atopobiaceae bacterium]